MPATKLWSRQDYESLVALGLLDGQRVQLIEGEIIDMGPQKSPHATAVTTAQYALLRVYGAGFVVRIQLPLALGDISEPEPDIAVVRGGLRDFTSAHPETARLVVEVSDSSLSYDRGEKASLYAKAGVPVYWLVDLVHRRVEVRTEPRLDSAAIFGHAYGTLETFLPGARFAAPETESSIEVDELLP